MTSFVLRAVLLGSLALPIAGAAQLPAPAPQSYRPGLGDLMTMTVQPRHTMLGLVGREQNWVYANYELHELEEAFERAARAWPQWRSMPVGGMINSLTKEPLAALAQAVKAADATRFATAYRQLTVACNACHQAANQRMIVIKVPEASPFPDQEFRPPKPRSDASRGRFV
ncbi:MAG TPA: hypothetical protein VMB81_28540 [Candidatus Sulfotelmatobacter sp.]|nr:hypothetical protein [Candidatus Sulfotelmatobacter sp.]